MSESDKCYIKKNQTRKGDNFTSDLTPNSDGFPFKIYSEFNHFLKKKKKKNSITSAVSTTQPNHQYIQGRIMQWIPDWPSCFTIYSFFFFSSLFLMHPPELSC